MADYVAYCRVLAEQQGASGLGLDTQRQAVVSFLNTGGFVTEFTKIESGRWHSNWPQLLAALRSTPIAARSC